MACLSCLPGPKKKKVAVEVTDGLPIDERPRVWEFKLLIRSFENVQPESIDCFWSISINVANPLKFRNDVRLLPEFTTAYVLGKAGTTQAVYTPSNPLILFDRKTFRLAYKGLHKQILKVDMWRFSSWTFNTYYGHGSRNLYKIANGSSDVSLTIQKKLSLAEMKKNTKAKSGASYDVAQIACTVNLEEIFNYNLKCENWNLELNTEHPQYKKRADEDKALTFVFPRTRKAEPLRRIGCTSVTLDWVPPPKFFWGLVRKPLNFTFSGTKTQLVNSYFIVSLHSVKKKFDQQPALQSVGKGLMSLTSVLDISVFNGIVKQMDTEKKRFIVGAISGNVKYHEQSVLVKVAEKDMAGCRPTQSVGRRSVTHLNSSEQHLVVRVSKCDGLPIADPEKGSSDPYLRVSWDHMTQNSPVQIETIRPIFNMCFYFPVRLFHEKLLRSFRKGKVIEAMKFELESKGPMTIQVWDQDDNCAEYLGGTLLHMFQLTNTNEHQQCTLLGTVKTGSGSGGEEDDFLVPRELQWFEEKKNVRIWKGDKTELIGATLENNATPLIHFEAWFYPDWPDGLRLKPKHAADEDSAIWQRKERDFDHKNGEFAQNYAMPFPDSVGAKRVVPDPMLKNESIRRFPSIGLHPQTYEYLPLMAFLVKIITPEEFSMASMLLHWISCITFESTSKQSRTGLIPPQWKDPQFVLDKRMGPAQDHAVLLCSLLLGCKQDAFVCKGTVWSKDSDDGEARKPRLVEHTWVMTRSDDGWVTFWEPCSREMYHLPKRCPVKTKRKKNKNRFGAGSGKEGEGGKRAGGGGEAGEGEAEDEDGEKADEKEVWDYEVPDVQLNGDDLEGLPAIGRMPQAKKKSNPKVAGRELMKAKMIAQRERLPTAPTKSLLGEETLVDWLPYDSIDVVFNMDNLWANRQNHHPACCMYNIDIDPEPNVYAGWMPLLKDEDKADKKLQFEYIKTDVPIEAAQPTSEVDKIANDLTMEMMENMRQYRNRKGLDTFFDKREPLLDHLKAFLKIHEDRRRLDVDFNPMTGITKKDEKSWTAAERYIVDDLNFATVYNKLGSPKAFDDEYRKQQKEGWRALIDQVESFLQATTLFPTKRGCVFSGFPVHFNTPDKEKIRTLLLDMPEYKSMLDDDTNGFYTVHTVLFPLLGRITSTWIYLGLQKTIQPTDKK